MPFAVFQSLSASLVSERKMTRERSFTPPVAYNEVAMRTHLKVSDRSRKFGKTYFFELCVVETEVVLCSYWISNPKVFIWAILWLEGLFSPVCNCTLHMI